MQNNKAPCAVHLATLEESCWPIIIFGFGIFDAIFPKIDTIMENM